MTIVLEGLQKVYSSGFRAVNNLDLRVEDGEFFTLLGPSGCGKTTTLRMIAGLESVSRGRISIGGKDFTNTHPRDRDVAMVFQTYALYPHMTVRQNLALNLEVKKKSQSDIEQSVLEVTRMLGIEKLLGSKPGQLSGGQRQRVALGRALIRRPNVFLMDEPLSNLDLKLRERTRTELKKLHERLRVTTVYVTHDQAEALVLSDRIGIMNAGDLLQVGPPQEIYDRPFDIFVAKFVGTPSINLLAVQAKEAAGKIRLVFRMTDAEIGGALLDAEADFIVRVRQLGEELTLGVRPEAIALLNQPSPGSIEAAIEIVEPMGSVNHVVLRVDRAAEATVDGEPFMAVVRSNEAFTQGSKTWISLRPDRLVLFDPTSGRAVGVLSGERKWRCA
jgi:multiple sugar transport system ATP-binding protein